ncbi:hypothetical protein KO361_00495 [Candidatus Woesearchaeota archaeon]|nr:hypothetical protein [Candidatus Woesearchaeota archaeon]
MNKNNFSKTTIKVVLALIIISTIILTTNEAKAQTNQWCVYEDTDGLLYYASIPSDISSEDCTGTTNQGVVISTDNPDLGCCCLDPIKHWPQELCAKHETIWKLDSDSSQCDQICGAYTFFQVTLTLDFNQFLVQNDELMTMSGSYTIGGRTGTFNVDDDSFTVPNIPEGTHDINIVVNFESASGFKGTSCSGSLNQQIIDENKAFIISIVSCTLTSGLSGESGTGQKYNLTLTTTYTGLGTQTPTSPSITYSLKNTENIVVKTGILTQDNKITDISEGTYNLELITNFRLSNNHYSCKGEKNNIQIEKNEEESITLTCTLTGNYDCEEDETCTLICEEGYELSGNDCVPEDGDPTTPSDCIPQWSIQWEYPLNQCGTGTIIVTNTCGMSNQELADAGVPQSVEPVLCPEDPSDPEDLETCGDGELQDHEECEYRGPNGPIFRNGNTCAEYYNNPNQVGNLICTNYCKIETSFCDVCPTMPSGCSSSLQCNQCSVCAEAPLCKPVCSIERLNDFRINAPIIPIFNEVIGLRFSWTIDNHCNSTIKIRRCISQEANTNCAPAITGTELTSIPATNSPYLDTAFEPQHGGKDVCYQLTYRERIEGQLVTKQTEIVCQKLPHFECLNNGGANFCYDTITPASCNSNTGQLNLGSECTNAVCVNPSIMNGQIINGEAWCLNVEICDSCSGPFGVYSYQSETFDADCDFRTTLACFREDYSNRQTIKGKYNPCSDIQSCYDYKTEYTCEQNTCGTVGLNDCEWNPLTTNNELGIGVCRPINEEERDCKACDENHLFGEHCPEYLCNLYGDCYYNAEPEKTSNAFIVNQYYCNNKYEVGCETYNDKEECEGNSEYELDVSYSLLISGSFARISGTHNILAESNDPLTLKKCVWNGETCVRDASYQKEYRTQENMHYLESDCENNKQSIECLTNFENPNTTIYIGAEEMQNKTYSLWQLTHVLGINTSEQVKHTYFSLNKTNNEYPKMVQQIFRNNVNNLELDNPTQYFLRYYSMDESNNLEQIKTKRIMLLPELNISISHNIVGAYLEEAQQVVSNLTVTTTTQTPSYEFLCKAELLLEDQDEYLPIGEKITRTSNDGQIIWDSYKSLVDGQYFFNVTCWDEYQRGYHEIKPILISMDDTITDPTPRGVTLPRNPDLEVSIRTKENADCELIFEKNVSNGENHELGDSINLIASQGGKLHTNNIDASIEGVYILRPKCTFTGTIPQGVPDNGEFIGNNGDLVYFAIDKTPPQLRLIDVNKTIYNEDQEPVDYTNSTIAKNSIELLFECNKTIPGLVQGPRDLSSPCAQPITYEIIHNKGFGDELKETNTVSFGQGFTVTAPTTFTNIYLNVTVSDLVGNTKNHRIFLNLRSDALQGMPQIIIYDAGQS